MRASSRAQYRPGHDTEALPCVALRGPISSLRRCRCAVRRGRPGSYQRCRKMKRTNPATRITSRIVPTPIPDSPVASTRSLLSTHEQTFRMVGYRLVGGFVRATTHHQALATREGYVGASGPSELSAPTRRFQPDGGKRAQLRGQRRAHNVSSDPQSAGRDSGWSRSSWVPSGSR